MLEFHGKYIRTTLKSKFAVRFLKKGKDGKVTSPYVSVQNNKFTFWDTTAKSVSETNPSLFHVVSLCRGIFAVPIELLETKGSTEQSSYVAKIMSLDDNAVVLLLEYDQNDVICNDSNQIVLRQCNIVKSYEAPQFKLLSSAQIKDVTNEFAKRKSTIMPNTYANNIVDYKKEITPFLSLARLNELDKKIRYLISQKILELGILGIRVAGDGDERVMNWFGVVEPLMPNPYGQAEIHSYVLSMRERFLSELTDNQVKLLERALCSARGLPCSSDAGIYHDARMIAYNRDVDESQLRSLVWKGFFKSGLKL